MTEGEKTATIKGTPSADEYSSYYGLPSNFILSADIFQFISPNSHHIVNRTSYRKDKLKTTINLMTTNKERTYH